MASFGPEKRARRWNALSKPVRRHAPTESHGHFIAGGWAGGEFAIGADPDAPAAALPNQKKVIFAWRQPRARDSCQMHDLLLLRVIEYSAHWLRHAPWRSRCNLRWTTTRPRQQRDIAIAQHRTRMQNQRQSVLVGGTSGRRAGFFTGIAGSSWLCRLSFVRGCQTPARREFSGCGIVGFCIRKLT